MPTAPPPLPTAKRIRRPATVWWLYLPGAFAALVGLTLYFDTTSEQTHAERGIEQSLALLILIVSAVLLAVATLITFFRPSICAACGTRTTKRSSRCPSCQREFG